MTISLLLVRHAEHCDVGKRLTGRGPEQGLVRSGWLQAEKLAETLRNERIDAIYTSPRLRTQQTADAIRAGRHLVVRTAEALDEIDFGEWTGYRFDELDGRAEWDAWNRERSRARCPGGESMAEAQDRAVSFVDEIARSHDGQQFAIVTHCDIIRALLCWHEGRSLDSILDRDVAPASVTRIVLQQPVKAAA